MSDDRSLTLGEARRQLYSVLEETEMPVVEKYRQALSIGCAYLGVENGHLKEVPGPDGKGARVSVAAGDISWISGDTALEAAGFCRIAIEREESLAITDARAEGYEDNPGYADHGVACYLAAPVTVGGQTYGTVCFVSPEPRDRDFFDEERLFVELLAQILGRQLEKEHYADALAESRSKYASLVSASPDPVFLLDTDTLRVVEANEAAASLTGYDRESLEGMSYPELWNAPGEAGTDEGVSWFTEHEGTRRTHPDGSSISVVRADGSTVPVEIGASWVSIGDRSLVHAVVRDIREERERERRTEAIFDQTHQFTGLLSPDGTLLEANDTAMAVCEESRAEILGRPFPECPWWQTDEETRDQLREAIDRAAAGEFVRYDVEVATVDGPMMIDFSIRPVTDDSGSVELLIPEGRDVTKRHKRDRQLDVLARVLRHNFRNDFSVLHGYAEHLAEHCEEELLAEAEKIQSTISGLFQQVENYHETVTLLSDPPNRCAVSLSERLSTLVSEYRENNPDATISLSVPDATEVRAVPPVDRAFDELLDNAITHTDDAEPRISVRARDDGDTVTVTIADDGPGMPDQEARILTGEQAITPLDHGSGIGLWRAYWICDLSGADVTVDADDGTAVTITFPTPD